MANIVAIVGRPNVGKSTLFNRLTESRKAIVDDFSGVTRDRHYETAEWIGKNFTVIDTGGFVHGSDDVFEEAIRDQVHIAIEEASAIIFMVDVTTGITDLDDEIADILRRSSKPVYVAANKVDHAKLHHDSAEFYAFGLGEIYNVSSATGSGTGELLDAVVSTFEDEPEDDTTLPKYTIVGRPNVGKSSLTNALLGVDRNIVTPVAGTTRDSIRIHYKQFGHEFLLIDTAGLRRKSKVNEDIEFYSVMRTIKALEDSDVVLLMLDANDGIEAQDINIFHLAEKNRKGIVIVVNKWDTIDKDNKTMKEFEARIKEKIAPFTDIPIVFTSVTEKQRIFKTLEVAAKVYENKTKKIPTSKLNEVMLQVIENYPPPALKGKYIKVKYVTQLPGRTPMFAFFCNLPQYVKDPYKRYIENKLREHFDFEGVPIQIYFRQK
ncbi:MULTISPECIES: ribosome biogenesis GTPase Der [Sphingobacterium]|jgi:GTP-binding protein|uniref:ribosome biogenesis GTPase Der n=1 Tax=Sphingobacterium TaxID=28453 RepID=UPI0004E5EED6|nr:MULTISPECIES: ribosome biogenesis GTPase Der [Sphingobacterium]UZJ66032.1 ribosome biogenesis GTPase Der [Sphingobacterium sp. KU25419]CDS91912.1 GTPase Der [Sphingobacterium sp. PM2-P1-29]SJN51396.1 GTP-binding protein EngA [Sphingobacterium faecium PCAi_F2.5]UPZ38300.1 ribosome biogenesis GTPase Der [Sphingobacterium sp. PCS056]UXD69736.1 ribosome biogenesis GTPase Der [Sphingobacterium faecium]